MKITVIHGQSHKGVSYTITHAVLKKLRQPGDELREFFLPKHGPDFCFGCNTCFLKGEDQCPGADRVRPIALAMEWADVIFLDSPNYVMEMSGALKNLMDHLAYRWVSHRPHSSMYQKVGVVVSSSAGAPPGGVTKSMAEQLKWMGVPKVYRISFISSALTVADLAPKKAMEIEKRAAKTASAVRRRAASNHASLRGKLTFGMMRKMQASAKAAWNPTDQTWWKNHGWLNGARPWKPK